MRHSSAHLVAAAALSLYPKAKFGVGPTVENGFYYDVDFVGSISEEDLAKIEEKAKEMAKQGLSFEREEMPIDEAIKFFKKLGQDYKVELLNDLKTKGTTRVKDEEMKDLSGAVDKVSLYHTGKFTDLCRGPHLSSSKEIGAFKLTKLAGAYWRGKSENPQLTRIYGVCFEKQSELDDYLKMMEEAEKRDHKKLGRELGLFTISPLVGSGLPLMQPKGMVIRQAIEQLLWALHKDKKYDRVWTPHIAKEELYITSGHAAKFGDELFRVQGKEEKFIMKPMNCPHHMQIFADNQFSYRDMPVRYFEPATVYRDEKSGQLGGLTRVRSITQDDGHLFCRVSQIEEEVSTIVGIIKEFYTVFGMMDGYWVSLSVRGDDKSKYLGTDEAWNTAEGALEKAAKLNGLNYKRVEGEAAFYGPKLDFIFKDVIGREWQLATIQCDFNLPERFDLSFINEKGEKERPVVIHRAISGSLERFMGVLIEHYAGAFPLWLAPVQVLFAPVSSKHVEGAQRLAQELMKQGIRVEVNSADETVGNKVRKAVGVKIPYIVVVGDKELAGEDWMVRVRGEEKQLKIKKEEFLEKIMEEIKTRKG